MKMVTFVCPTCGNETRLSESIAAYYADPNRKFDITCSKRGHKTVAMEKARG